MAMQDADLARSVMLQLQAMGVSVALDDFGTGLFFTLILASVSP